MSTPPVLLELSESLESELLELELLELELLVLLDDFEPDWALITAA